MVTSPFLPPLTVSTFSLFSSFSILVKSWDIYSRKEEFSDPCGRKVRLNGLFPVCLLQVPWSRIFEFCRTRRFYTYLKISLFLSSVLNLKCVLNILWLIYEPLNNLTGYKKSLIFLKMYDPYRRQTTFDSIAKESIAEWYYLFLKSLYYVLYGLWYSLCE